MTFNQYVQKLYPFYGNGGDEADFIIKLLGSATTDQEDKVFNYKPEYLKRIYNGKKNITSESASYILTNLNKEGLNNTFLYDIPSEDAFSELCKIFKPFLGETTIEELPYKLSDLFVRILSSIATKESKHKKSKTIKKDTEINLTNTINDSGFENVFIEVPHDKDLGLLNNNHIKTFHFNIESNKFSHIGLQRYLLKNKGRYIYSRLQIDEFTTNNEQEIIAHEAIKKLKESGFSDEQLGDELGNIIIYLFLEKILQAPKLYTNIECQEVGLNKAGVHLLKLSGQDKDFQMVFSKSNIANDLKESIDNAFKNLSFLNKSIPNHYRFLETSILTQNFDNATSEHLKNIIIPQKREHETIVNNAFGVLIGYSINIDRNVDNKTFVKNLKEQMIKDLQEQLPYIVTKINDLEMQNSSFYIYLMPFDNANNDKSTIMRNIVGGSV